MGRLAEQANGERQARMMLSMIAEPDDEITGRVLHRVGGVETIRLLEDNDPVPGMNRADAIAWRQRLTPRIDDDIPERIADAERHGMNTLIPTDADWPHALNDLGARAPYLLWTRGATSFLSDGLADRITITGARAATEYGTNVAAHLAGELARDEHTIVSGGAYGIDGAAHRAALSSGGQTIAVVPGGPDRLYPAGHRDMLERVGDVGLLMSEMPPGAAPTRHRFIARGRLLAALSSATVIVETGARSGSLHVAREAHALGRGVGAVPGPVTSAASTGTHLLLSEGTASLVTGHHDLASLTSNRRQGPARTHRLGAGQDLDAVEQERPGRSL